MFDGDEVIEEEEEAQELAASSAADIERIAAADERLDNFDERLLDGADEDDSDDREDDDGEDMGCSGFVDDVGDVETVDVSTSGGDLLSFDDRLPLDSFSPFTGELVFVDSDRFTGMPCVLFA